MNGKRTFWPLKSWICKIARKKIKKIAIYCNFHRFSFFQLAAARDNQSTFVSACRFSVLNTLLSVKQFKKVSHILSMFDGDHRVKKRSVNLGRRAATSASNKQQLLENARKDRAQRARIQRENESCLQIQKLLRGYRSNKKCALLVSNEYNDVATGVSRKLNLFAYMHTSSLKLHVQKAGATVNPPTLSVIKNSIESDSLGPVVLRFYHFTILEDPLFADEISFYRLQISHSIAVKMNFNPYLVPKLIQHLQSALYQTHDDDIEKKRQVLKKILDILAMFAQRQRLLIPRIAGAVLSAPERTMQNLFDMVSETLKVVGGGNELVDIFLSTSMDDYKDNSNEENRQLLTNIMNIVEGAKMPSNTVVAKFPAFLISILESDETLMETVCYMVAGEGLMSEKYSSLNTMQDGNSSSDDEARNHGQVNKSSPNSSTIKGVNDAVQVQLTEQSRKVLVSYAPVISPILKKLSERLASSDFLPKLATTAISAAPAAVVELSSIFSRFLKFVSGSNQLYSPCNLLNKLSFQLNFIKATFRAFKANNPSANSVRNSSSTQHLLITFCEVYSHILTIRTDEDFAGEEAFLREIVVNLKPILCNLYFDEPVYEGPQLVRRLMCSATKVYNNLYKRWGRGGWCEEELWLWESAARWNGEAGGDDMADDEENSDDNLVNMFKDVKMARVLNALPFVLSFDQRVLILSSLIAVDKRRTQDEMHAMMMLSGEFGPMGEQIRVRREYIYEDSMKGLNELGTRLRGRVQVSFLNKHGVEEAGIDGGGVFKEFVDDLVKEAFDADQPLKLVRTTDDLLLFLNPDVSATDNFKHFEFLGRVLGKAVYESILVEPQFCLPFLNKLLNKVNTLDDLRGFDRVLFNNLSALRRMGEEEIKNLCLTFEVQSSVNSAGTFLGGVKSVELVSRGSQTPVSKQNCIQYIHLVANHKLNVEQSKATRSFLRGFRDIIPASYVRMFSAKELQKIFSGDDEVKGIDVDDLKNVMVYSGGYHPSQDMIIWFWQIVKEMENEMQRKLLRFITSCSRKPLLGFKALTPVPCIQKTTPSVNSGGGVGSERLPTSSTCMNLLKLPSYSTKEKLKEKLYYAVNSGAGFELS